VLFLKPPKMSFAVTDALAGLQLVITKKSHVPVSQRAAM
jgi:hypothetical protein